MRLAMENSDDLLTDLFRAYYDARVHKRNTRSQLAFELDLERNLFDLYEQIRDRNYKPAPAMCFITHIPVKREIFASAFRDRVVHHLLFNYLAPLFEKQMIFDSYSCRKQKGTLLGIERFEHHIRSCTDNYIRPAYILKLDLRGYFMSIDKQRLYEIICRTTDVRTAPGKALFDHDLVDFLLRAILFRNPVENCRMLGSPSDWDGFPASKSLIKSPPGVGLPIGDLTSQLFSNIYLNELDQFVKRELRCHHYGRYVDDFFIVHPSRSYLRQLIPCLQEFLSARLRLTLHPNKIVLQQYKQGALFLGACVMPHRRYPANTPVRRFRAAMTRLEKECAAGDPSRERLEEMLPVINSYCGYLSHFRSYRILKAQFGSSVLRKYFRFATNFRKAVLKKKFRYGPLPPPSGRPAIDFWMQSL